MDIHQILAYHVTYGEIDFVLNASTSALVVLRRRLAEDVAQRRMIHSEQLVIWRWQLERRIRLHDEYYQREYGGCFAAVAKDFPLLRADKEEHAHFAIVLLAYYGALLHSETVSDRVPTHLRPLPPFHGLVSS